MSRCEQSGGKVRFESWRTAKHAMRQIIAAEPDPAKHPKARFYCTACKGIHLSFPTLPKAKASL